MQILEHGMSSREVMPRIFERHQKAADRAWLQETVFGVLRMLPTLQSWLRQLLKAPLKKQQKIIEQVIMVGLFQQAYMRTSSHAAVSETVEASKILKQPQLSGLVNAVLRSFARDKLSQQEATEAHVKANLPKWLYKKLALAYPENMPEICQAMQQKPPLWLRVNPLVVSLHDYCALLTTQNFTYEIHLPFAVRLSQYTDVTRLPLFAEGGFSVQDLAAQQASRLLDVQPGERILDACAAPGGKTAAIIEACPELTSLVAMDSAEQRNTRTIENLTRLKHFERLGDKLQVVSADASNPLSFALLPQFDKILLDAPCSATGIIRRHPDIKWHRKANDIEALCKLQSALLDVTWNALRPGGILLYATCSILPQENGEQVARFLSAHADAKTLPILDAEGDNSLGWQILPGCQHMDGFFYARLLKSA
jgi:16S rRNA (cytosine967-C5)-methyltransferase